jgi:hypothetical protein
MHFRLDTVNKYNQKYLELNKHKISINQLNNSKCEM